MLICCAMTAQSQTLDSRRQGARSNSDLQELLSCASSIENARAGSGLSDQAYLDGSPVGPRAGVVAYFDRSPTQPNQLSLHIVTKNSIHIYNPRDYLGTNMAGTDALTCTSLTSPCAIRIQIPRSMTGGISDNCVQISRVLSRGVEPPTSRASESPCTHSSRERRQYVTLAPRNALNPRSLGAVRSYLQSRLSSETIRNFASANTSCQHQLGLNSPSLRQSYPIWVPANPGQSRGDGRAAGSAGEPRGEPPADAAH